MQQGRLFRIYGDCYVRLGKITANHRASRAYWALSDEEDLCHTPSVPRRTMSMKSAVHNFSTKANTTAAAPLPWLFVLGRT